MLSIIDNTGAYWRFPEDKLDITIGYINRIGRHVSHIQEPREESLKGTSIGKPVHRDMETIWKMQDRKRKRKYVDKTDYKAYRRNLDRQILRVCEQSRLSKEEFDMLYGKLE